MHYDIDDSDVFGLHWDIICTVLFAVLWDVHTSSTRLHELHSHDCTVFCFQLIPWCAHTGAFHHHHGHELLRYDCMVLLSAHHMAHEYRSAPPSNGRELHNYGFTVLLSVHHMVRAHRSFSSFMDMSSHPHRVRSFYGLTRICSTRNDYGVPFL